MIACQHSSLVLLLNVSILGNSVPDRGRLRKQFRAVTQEAGITFEHGKYVAKSSLHASICVCSCANNCALWFKTNSLWRLTAIIN